MHSIASLSFHLSLLCLVSSFFKSFPTQRYSLSLYANARLLKDPNPNSIGNFFDKTTEDLSFIQCYMLAMAEIGENQYGVGFPVDMPVMLTYFEGNDLKPVKEGFLNYDHLINHVSVQLESSSLNLYKTPVVLTLQGEFDDEQMNQIYTPKQALNIDDEYVDNIDDVEEEEELTVADIIAMEGLDDDEDEDDEIIDEDDDEDVEDDFDNSNDSDKRYDIKSFLNSSPAGKNNNNNSPGIPDISIYRPEKPDLSDIPLTALVTDEDTKSLRRAHRKADKIIKYAADVKLIASFHYAKQNFHLVKLLEPMFIVGRRMTDIKGFYFELLNDEDSFKITPVLEKMLINRPKQAETDSPVWRSNRNEGNRESPSGRSSDGNSQGNKNNLPPADRISSRRRWKDRKSSS